MTIDEWIGKLDNEEADRLTQFDQCELKVLLMEAKRYKKEAESYLDTLADLKEVLARQGI